MILMFFAMRVFIMLICKLPCVEDERDLGCSLWAMVDLLFSWLELVFTSAVDHITCNLVVLLK